MHTAARDDSSIVARVDDLTGGDTVAKAGVMVRATLDPASAMAILDIRPGCAVAYLGGANVGTPAWLRLTHTGTTFSASVMPADKSTTVDLGSVTVPMSAILPGFAVTSHDPSQTAIGVFNNPPQ